MPCGMFIRRRAENNFTKEYPGPFSFVATEWLANIEHEEGIEIQHARNMGEYKVGIRQISVDGYCQYVYYVPIKILHNFLHRSTSFDKENVL